MSEREPVGAVEGSAPVEQRPDLMPVCADQSQPPAPRDGLPTDDEISAVNAVADEHGVSRDVMHIALAKVHRLIAARVRAEAVAEERQRIEAALNAELLAVTTRYIGTTEAALGYVDGLSKGLSIAAGSVPVATPPTLDERLTAYLDARGIELSAGCLIGQAAYVEEEARELLDAAEANDWLLARLEIGDVAHALIGTARQLGTTVEACMDEKLAADRGRGNARPVARPCDPLPAAPDGA